MKKYYQLTEFLLKLIKVQIEKYSGLFHIGVGPDAGINAILIFTEVDELIKFTIDLLNLIKQNKSDDTLFNDILIQTRFYLDQERLRGYAAWLIDENNIHSTEYLRFKQYDTDIQNIIKDNDPTHLTNYIPRNDCQRQCEHDSHAITYKITDLAIKLRQDPTIKFNQNIVPLHAQKILRRHANPEKGRYHQPEIYIPIKKLHNKCFYFLKKSALQTSTKKLSIESMSIKKQNHIKKFLEFLSQFKQYYPTSILFSNEPTWYKISVRNQIIPETEKNNRVVSLFSRGFFSTQIIALSIGTVAILALIFNLAWSQDKQYPPNPCL